MKLQDQVCSLELSKRLKILGVRQESFAYWYKPHSCWQLRIDRSDLGTDWENNEIVSAFTVAEMGEMIPEGYYTEKTSSVPGRWCAWETEDGLYDKDGNYITATTEADARAKMLIYLIENKLIPAPGKE